MRRAWEFGKLFLFSPSKAADACLRKEALSDGLKLYALLAVAELASSWFNPLSFLDPNAPVTPAHGLGFWMRVAMWEPVLFGLSIFFTVLILDWMREGWLFKKFMAATLWAATPAALAAYYASPTATLHKPLFVMLLAAWCAPALWLSRRVPAEYWRKVGIFLLGLNAIQLVSLAVEYLTVVPLRSKIGFYVLGIVSLVWVLACAGIGLRKLCAMSTARVVLGFILAVLAVPIAIGLAFVLGLMPMEVLKVVLYV
jgi:hypothetical protein